MCASAPAAWGLTCVCEPALSPCLPQLKISLCGASVLAMQGSGWALEPGWPGSIERGFGRTSALQKVLIHGNSGPGTCARQHRLVAAGPKPPQWGGCDSVCPILGPSLSVMSRCWGEQTLPAVGEGRDAARPHEGWSGLRSAILSPCEEEGAAEGAGREGGWPGPSCAAWGEGQGGCCSHVRTRDERVAQMGASPPAAASLEERPAGCRDLGHEMPESQ